MKIRVVKTEHRSRSDTGSTALPRPVGGGERGQGSRSSQPIGAAAKRVIVKQGSAQERDRDKSGQGNAETSLQ